MKRLTEAIVARGERRISETRAHVEQCRIEVRAEIDRLYEVERRLTAENRVLREALRD